MLKSTHKPAAPAGDHQPLPPGWTVHTAPTGHLYYHNKATQHSTYTHPSATIHAPAAQFPAQLSYPQGALAQHGFMPNTSFGQFGQPSWNNRHPGFQTGQHRNQNSQGRWQRPQPRDRPKSKHALPGQEPWLLVRTKLGRQFVFNADQGKSFWKIPDELKDAVTKLELEIKDKEQTAALEKTTAPRPKDEAAKTPIGEVDIDDGRSPPVSKPGGIGSEDDEDEEAESDEYEEVEVTDTEDDENPSKRPRLDEENNQAREFNEDDIAYQLAAMGQNYADGAEEDWQEDAEQPPLTEEETKGLFRDLLEDHGLNPYSIWDKILQEGKIIEDERYTILPNMKTRKEVWAEWSRDKIQALKEQRAKAEAKNPLLPYLAFLEKNASVKLYWPEFKRKYKNAPEMRDVKLTDKQREKWYRDYVARLKLPESTLKSDFSALLKSQPLSILSHSSIPSNLPTSVITDIRYISLPSKKRDELVAAYISTLPPAPTTAADGSTGLLTAEEEQQRSEETKQREDRERRRQALAEREARITMEKQRQDAARRAATARLREEEREVERAMRVGKEGLRAQLSGAVPGKGEDGEEGK